MANQLKQCYRDRGGWCIGFHYDAELVETLKKAVPHMDREWNADKKLWWIDGRYEGILLNLFPGFAVFKNQPSLF